MPFVPILHFYKDNFLLVTLEFLQTKTYRTYPFFLKLHLADNLDWRYTYETVIVFHLKFRSRYFSVRQKLILSKLKFIFSKSFLSYFFFLYCSLFISFRLLKKYVIYGFKQLKGRSIWFSWNCIILNISWRCKFLLFPGQKNRIRINHSGFRTKQNVKLLII